VTARTRLPAGGMPRPARILAALAESPGQGAYELAAALGYDGRRTAAALKRMQSGGAVEALELARPGAGRPARIYFVAPEGTPPPPRRRESPAETEERRRRARVAQQRRRARLAGKPVTAEPIARPRLHLPAAPPAWRLPGEPACSGADPDLFFPERWESGDAAEAICAGCPVRRCCLDGAIDRGERFGIWGGVNFETERRALVRPA